MRNVAIFLLILYVNATVGLKVTAKKNVEILMNAEDLVLAVQMPFVKIIPETTHAPVKLAIQEIHLMDVLTSTNVRTLMHVGRELCAEILWEATNAVAYLDTKATPESPARLRINVLELHVDAGHSVKTFQEPIDVSVRQVLKAIPMSNAMR